MATQTVPTTKQRAPLSRERVLRAALDLADKDGIESLSMRKLGEKLGVEAMSLYNHVANKDDILDGIVDLVFGEIALPAERAPWKTAARGRAISAHEALLRHPWAPSLMQSRTRPGPATLRHHDSGHALVHVLQQDVEGQGQKDEERRVQQVGHDSHPDKSGVCDKVSSRGRRVAGGVHLGIHVSLRKTADASPDLRGLDLILDGLESARKLGSKATARKAAGFRSRKRTGKRPS